MSPRPLVARASREARAASVAVVRLGACLLAAAVASCASTPMKPPPAPAAPADHAAAADRAADERAIALALDDLHDAAAHADETRYFAHFAEGFVFLGTDATERWNVAAFRAFAHPHFAAGHGWTYRATRRAIAFSRDGAIAWFDEDLLGDKVGACRGSGVLQRDGAGHRWLLTQYNLALTVPNERFSAVRAAIDGPKQP